MDINDVIELKDGYKIQLMDGDDFFKIQNNIKNEIFKADHSLYPSEYLTDLEKIQIELHRENLYKERLEICLALFDRRNDFVGWMYGYQNDQYSFYMCNSAIVEEHRKKGLYTSLMKVCLDIAAEEGFQVVYSRHNATNNPIIIPKLKAGFLISSLEVDDVFGVLVTLKYFTNEKRRKIMDYRCGQSAPDKEIKSLFKL